ncbi:hypothetical protein GCM10010446_10470 [Streptomyces enissocaesilis]|uniref:Dehydrogenase n=1 Tax=Streptomyces enissocaesilis TaxID=332589 RepID=A0ABN3WVE4_9ACTN
MLVDLFGWRSVFYVNLPFGILLIFAAVRLLPRPADPDKKQIPDPLGTLLVALAVGATPLGVTEGGTWGWWDARTLACLVGVNNAGVSGVVRGERRSLDEMSVETLRSTLETNFVGAFALTHALLPALRTAGGRVVNVTSALATFARTTGRGPAGPADLIPYRASKAALNMTSVLLADQLREWGVTVCAVSPGYVATDMNNFAGSKTVQEGARTIVRFATLAPEELPDRAFVTEEGVVPW